MNFWTRIQGRRNLMDSTTCVPWICHNQLILSSVSFFSSSNKDVIWLHHRRLGHLTFPALQIMYPSLFMGLDVQSLHCEICGYAKHTRVSFPISNKRSSSPFHLIHSDIWEPLTVPNISGYRWFVCSLMIVQGYCGFVFSNISMM